MKTKLIALFFYLLCQSVSAQVDGRVFPDVRGGADCAKWLQPENATREFMNKAWLVGYLSGLNIGIYLDERRKPFNYFEGVTPQQINLWMDNYCRTNPLSNVTAGAADLYTEKTKK
jgi:hypothetical protein